MRFVAAIFIIFLSAGNIKSFADRVLSFRSVPVDPKEKRWDFSKSIDMAEIHIDNSLISISGTFPTALTLLLSITNIQGNSLHQVPLEMAEGENLKQVEIPSMPPGQYIMTISSGTPVSRKVVYHINQ